MKKLHAINGNTQKLDGGAMFGHVPKAVWSKWLTPDAMNRITLACRALLVQDGERNILLETGIGTFFPPNMRERYGVDEENHVLLDSLQALGLTHQDIDVVILSHLHFDHAGGLLSAWQENQSPSLLFPNATYLVSQIGWERACQPHVRDRASFIPELIDLLKSSGRLVMVNQATSDVMGADYQFLFSDGHTPGLMHTVIKIENDAPVIFASDLIPGSSWVHLPVTMGYDRAPELVIDEKKKMLDYAIEKQARLFYTHDPRVAMSRVERDEGGKYRAV